MRRLTLVVAAMLLFAACGDDGEVSLEDYFAEIEAAAITYDEASAAADEVLNTTSDPVRDFKELFPSFADDLKAFVDALDGMTPPAEIAAEHAKTIEAGKSTYAAFELLLIELEAVTDLPGLNTVFEGPAMVALGEAGDQFSASCTDLEEVASAAGIETDLRCG